MPLSIRAPWFVLAFASLLARMSTCGADLFAEESDFRALFDSSTLTVQGRAVDSTGAPLAGCTVRVASGDSTLTASDGTFTLAGLSRSNQLLTLTLAGYYDRHMPLQLYLPLSETDIGLPPVVVWERSPSVVRFLFGGDTAFARRMLDPEERAARDEMPIENPDALISVLDPLPGTLEVVQFVKPLFLAADYPVLNFESVVTRDPSTPHLQKDFVYFTLPDSLPALTSLNLDYVGVGNNHTYDYLESGVSNTSYHLDMAGIHHSGLGSNATAAFAPYRAQVKGTPYSFLAMTSIGGERYVMNYVAGPNKGGAAYIESYEEAQTTIAAEAAAGRVTIVQPHIGTEYTFEPTPFTTSLMEFAVDAGGDLIVAHHPHVAQGFGMHRGVLLIHCLGNLFFDQDRLETMVGLLATVDMEGRQLQGAWGTPVYLEDYRPRLISGDIAPVILRRIAEFSRQVRVFPYNGQAWVARRPSEYSFVDRRIVIPLTIGSNGWTTVDLRELAGADESLARLEADVPGLMVRPGRDLMNFGDFEDVDVDWEQGEASRWSFGSSTLVSLQSPYRGTAALSLQRSSANISDSVVAFRNRVRVMGDAHDEPNKDVSLVGYMRGVEAGPIRIVSRYYASEGAAQFGEETPLHHPGGTFAWELFASDLHLPPDDPTQTGDPPAVNARAVRIFLRHSPPAAGAGYVSFDEIAIVNWEEALDPFVGPVLDTPHARDYLRVQGASGTYALALTFRRYRPAAADVGHGPGLMVQAGDPGQSPDELRFSLTAVGFHDTHHLLVWNVGNQALVVSNLTFASGGDGNFSAQWLDVSGSPESGPILIIPPNGSARLEVRFQPVLAGLRAATLQFESNDPDATESLTRILVQGEAYADRPVRVIADNRTQSPTVHIQIPPGVVATNLLWEEIPVGLTPVNFSPGGQWQAGSRTLQWQNVTAGTTVRYALQGSPGYGELSGWLASAGQLNMTAGDRHAILLEPEDSDGDQLPDWWEHHYFDTRTGVRPEVDSDANGQNNLSAFLQGEPPLADGFQAQQWAPFVRFRVDDDFVNLQVFGFEGASFRLEASGDLQHWVVVHDNVLAGQTVSIPRTTIAGTDSLFYRAMSEEL